VPIDPIARKADDLGEDGGCDELLGAAAAEDTDAPPLGVFLASSPVKVDHVHDASVLKFEALDSLAVPAAGRRSVDLAGPPTRHLPPGASNLGKPLVVEVGEYVSGVDLRVAALEAVRPTGQRWAVRRDS
jgi:hypothetical protein